MDLNTNFGNLANLIRSSFETSPIKEVNKEINILDRNLYRLDKGGIGINPSKYIEAYEKSKELEEMKAKLGQSKTKINEVASATKQATTELEKMSNIKTNNLNQELDKTDSKIKKITSSSNKSNFSSNLKTALGIGTVALGIRKAFNFVKSSTNESVDFVEQQNLFNVSMGKTVDQYGNLDREASKYYLKATAFQDKLSEKLGINIAESMQYQALFNAMSKSMGISARYSYILSENFTKLGYDLASLYNIDPENAMQKLRAGLSGQTKPLRDLGLDITQQSLEPLLDELGIERSVKQLSQAEKMVARYIVVLRQASLAHGDFAKTMDSPANQLRIFNAQLIAFKRNVGNLWQGLLGNILPYVNAIMMVINELLKMVAKLFGFEVSDQNISAGIGADDLADDLGAATDKAKELKNQLMGFDEINNITFDKKSSSGSGASVGGIDQRLLDAMKEYDNMMDKVKSKATEIRDKMMEWLGFERIGDGWQLKEGLTNAEKILDVMKAIGVAIGTWKVASTVTGLFEKLGIMEKTDAFKMSFGITLAITGIFAQYKGTQHLLDGDVDLFTLLETVLGTAAGTWGIVNILKATSFGKTLSLGQQIKIGLGIMLAVQAIQVVSDGIEKNDIKKQIIGALEAGISGFLVVGSVLKYTIGLKVGLVITGLTLVYEANQVGAKEWAPLKKLLGLDDYNSQAGIMFKNSTLEFTINQFAFSWKTITDWFPELKEKIVQMFTKTLKNIAIWISKNVPFVGGKIGEAITNGIEGSEWLIEETTQDAATMTVEEFNKTIENSQASLQKSLEYTTISAIDNITPENIEKWRNLAQKSEKEYKKEIDKLNEDTRLILETILGKVDINTPEYIEKWRKMASESSLKYNTALSKLPDDTRAKILASTIAVTGMTETTKTAYENLSTEGKKAFSKALEKMKPEAKQKVQDAINSISSKANNAYNAGHTIGSKASSGVKSGLGNANTLGKNFATGFANGITSAKELVEKSAKNMVNASIASAAKAQLSHSPSKKTRQLGIYNGEGFALGIKDMIPEAVKNAKNLALSAVGSLKNNLSTEGITINPNDFKIDTNHFIDYGQISGAIATQSNINVSSDIEGRIENAIYRGLSNVTIPIEIEAITDEGVIFKKVQVKAKEFTMQTGEPAFEY